MDRNIPLYRNPIDEKCVGCGRIVHQPNLFTPASEICCSVYLDPGAAWSGGRRCPMATHTSGKKSSEDFKLNPLKKSKRSQEIKKI